MRRGWASCCRAPSRTWFCRWAPSCARPCLSMSLVTSTTSPRMTTLSLLSSLSPTPHATTRSPFDVDKTTRSAPSTQIVLLLLLKYILQRLRFPLTSLFPSSTWSWDRVGYPRCARSLRFGVPKDPIYTGFYPSLSDRVRPRVLLLGENLCPNFGQVFLPSAFQ